MAADNAARRPRGNSSKGTLATRRSRAWNGLSPASLPAPRGAGPPRSGCADASCPMRSSEHGGSSRVQEPGQPLQPQKRVRGLSPYPRWRCPAGTAQCVPASVSQDRGGPDLASHLTRPYRRRLELQPLRGVAIKRGPHCCDSGARIGCRTCVPRSARRWLARSRKALLPGRCRS